MKERELFSGLVAVPPVFIRLDGRSFHRLTADLGLARPFDERFSSAMMETAVRVMAESGLSPLLAFTFSDEISLYLPVLPFGGRVEKLDSVSASFAASCLTTSLRIGNPISFDARIISVTPELACQYLIGRQVEAWRNHMNAYCHEALVEEGVSPREAAAQLKGRPAQDLHQMMFERGINLVKTPAWQRRGILVYRRPIRVDGFNPLTGKPAETVRSEVFADRDLPLFSSPEGLQFLSSLLSGP
jgi:tRNA(His) guanylyltransferase